MSVLYAEEGETLEVGLPLLGVISIEELTGGFSETGILTGESTTDLHARRSGSRC